MGRHKKNESDLNHNRIQLRLNDKYDNLLTLFANHHGMSKAEVARILISKSLINNNSTHLQNKLTQTIQHKSTN